jgi:hypothetical protein
MVCGFLPAYRSVIAAAPAKAQAEAFAENMGRVSNRG